MLNLWSDVTEGTFGMAGSEGVSASVSAEIESAVTDDPVSMVEYVGSCTEGMIAVEAALALAEGRSVAKYLTATDESTKAELRATMEGVLSNAWERIKDYAERAYEAIKKFLKKVWAKMKGYANIVRAMMTKYGKVIGSKDTSGLNVSWVYVTLTGQYAREVKSMADAVMTASNASRMTEDTDTTDFKGAMERMLYRNGDTESHTVAFTGEIKKTAIKVADDGFDWLYKDLFQICESSERDLIKRVNDYKKEANDAIDDAKGPGATEDNKDKVKNVINKQCRKAINIIRTASVMGNKAATTLYQQSVTACRKAIRYNAGDRSASEESADFSSLMASVL